MREGESWRLGLLFRYGTNPGLAYPGLQNPARGRPEKHPRFTPKCLRQFCAPGASLASPSPALLRPIVEIFPTCSGPRRLASLPLTVCFLQAQDTNMESAEVKGFGSGLRLFGPWCSRMSPGPAICLSVSLGPDLLCGGCISGRLSAAGGQVPLVVLGSRSLQHLDSRMGQASCSSKSSGCGLPLPSAPRPAPGGT